MARDVNASLELEINSLESHGLINLFEVETQQEINATPADYAYWAEYNSTISYFVPETTTPQDYSPFPIGRSEIETDDGSKIPSLRLNIGAVSQEITAYIENNDALRRHRVRAVTVAANELACASACLVDTFFIDGATIDHDKEIAVFELTSKGNTANVSVPLRRMRRDYCYKRYNASDCRASSGPASLILPPLSDSQCRRTKDACASKGNVINFGGFPGIGTARIVRF
uniref:Putative tail protein n=1 Tax=viral metagenome TaxID=1070528 RepID=A0A6H1ZHH6_9ZZZZ